MIDDRRSELWRDGWTILMDNQEKQAIRDEEHLKLLRVGYLVAGGADAFFALFPLIYVVIGVVLTISGAGSSGRAGGPNPAVFGLIFVIIGLIVSFLFAAQAALKFSTARAIGRRQSRNMCMVAAALSCLQMPWGTFLGVLTFLVLGRQSVKDLFDPPNSSQRLVAPAERSAASLFDEQDVRVVCVHGGKSSSGTGERILRGSLVNA